MDELIKLLDENLEYIDHEIKGDTIYIQVVSCRKKAVCPYCGQSSDKVHSKYIRTFQDLPIQGKKVVLVLLNRKFFCNNSECGYKTFAERFSFFTNKAKKTMRLENEIVKLSLNCSSIAASSLLKGSVANVGKSTICNILKKRRTNN